MLVQCKIFSSFENATEKLTLHLVLSYDNKLKITKVQDQNTTFTKVIRKKLETSPRCYTPWKQNVN